MARYQWRVGLLSELPPQGKVGISPVCVLGLNVNRGQEIKLRLRTDDLRGFRKYDKIRETLIHELAHMVGVLRAWDGWERETCCIRRGNMQLWLAVESVASLAAPEGGTQNGFVGDFERSIEELYVQPSNMSHIL